MRATWVTVPFMPASETRLAPGSTAALGTANQRRVVDVLRGRHGVPERDRSGWTQADIARTTGLAPATVSNIVRALVADHLVVAEPGAGRRGGVVRLSPEAGVVAGIDFGHSHVSVALGTLDGRVLGERRHPLAADHPYDEGLDLAARLLGELREASPDLEVRTIGLGLPAPVMDGVVQSSAILPGWVGQDASEVAAEHLGLPIHIDNDANLGALAESRVGVGQGMTSMIFVKVSSGVGAGLVLDGRIHRGVGGTAGEIGHLTLDVNGPVCRCGGRGCLEAYASTGAVTALMAPHLPGALIDDVVTAAGEGSVPALRLLEDAGLHLGWGLASVVNLVNPGLVVVGGDMARAGEHFLEPVRHGLRRHALDAAAGTPVVASELGERASLIGALLLAGDRTELLASV